MDETLHSLFILLLKAIPTIVFFLFLWGFLDRIYFRPVAAILEERRQQTEGVRQLSDEALRTADQKQTEFERALQLAREEIRKENEALRQQWIEQHNTRIAKARADADQRRAVARDQIRQESDSAQASMGSHIDSLANTIVERLLGRRAA